MDITATNKELPAVMAAIKAVEPNLGFNINPDLLAKAKLTLSLDLQYEVAPNEVAEIKISITP
jgi:hypothetical protein